MLSQMKYIALIAFLTVATVANSQLPDHTYKSNIRSIRLHKAGDPYGYPVIRLNSVDDLDLYFDDLDGGVKNYYYTFQLCNADWTPSNLYIFDYVKGFQSIQRHSLPAGNELLASSLYSK